MVDNSRRALLGAFALAPAVVAPGPLAASAEPLTPPMPPLPEGHIWVSVPAAAWNDLLDAAQALGGP